VEGTLFPRRVEAAKAPNPVDNWRSISRLDWRPNEGDEKIGVLIGYRKIRSSQAGSDKGLAKNAAQFDCPD